MTQLGSVSSTYAQPRIHTHAPKNAFLVVNDRAHSSDAFVRGGQVLCYQVQRTPDIWKSVVVVGSKPQAAGGVPQRIKFCCDRYRLGLFVVFGLAAARSTRTHTFTHTQTHTHTSTGGSVYERITTTTTKEFFLRHRVSREVNADNTIAPYSS